MNRKIDDLGRLVIPREMMNTLGIETGEEVTINLNEKEGRIEIYKTEYICLLEKIDEILTNIEKTDSDKLDEIVEMFKNN